MAAVAPALFPEMRKRGAKPGDLVALLAARGCADWKPSPPVLSFPRRITCRTRSADRGKGRRSATRAVQGAVALATGRPSGAVLISTRPSVLTQHIRFEKLTLMSAPDTPLGARPAIR
ncbi:hypothetical protein [Paracoccus mutanolyticus]|uniref:hypothetical protein n=1 Tax=Paracoccus mutanolyticus TaxID=1499308 RepID=UPI0021D526CC|nr:hypothetical protein [Paracoccus mutanolyticus]